MYLDPCILVFMSTDKKQGSKSLFAYANRKFPTDFSALRVILNLLLGKTNPFLYYALVFIRIHRRYS